MVDRSSYEEALLDARVHRLSDGDDFVEYVLCFPYRGCREYGDRVKWLLKTGFKEILEYGGRIGDYYLIGKGYSSVSVLAYNEYYGLGLLKIRRVDGRRTTLEYEGMINDFLEKTGYVPALYLWSRDFIFREYLGKDCMCLVKLLDDLLLRSDRASLINVLKKTLSALYLFDALGVDHGELNRPFNHIFWCRGFVKIIDWESSSFVRRPHNLTSLVSFLLHRYKYKDKLIDLFNLDYEEMHRLLRIYKEKPSTRFLEKIFKLLDQPVD